MDSGKERQEAGVIKAGEDCKCKGKWSGSVGKLRRTKAGKKPDMEEESKSDKVN
jgi:hypothetical protein